MKKKSIKKNYLFNVTYQLLLLIVPFITTPYLSRVLGADGIGLNSYANAMVSYFTLFACLGTGTYGQRAISYVQDKKEERSRIFWENVLFRITTVLITLIFYGVYLLIVKDNFLIYLVLSLNIINVALDISWFFQGLEEFDKTVIRSIIIKLLNIVFIFLFVKDQDDLIVYILGTMILSILGSISLWTYVPKYICKVKKIRPFRDIKTIIKLFIPTVAVQVYTIVDKSMLGWFTSGDNYLENGYYEQAEKVSKLCLTVVTSLGTVMVPRIGKTFKDGDIKKVKEYMYNSYRFVWLLSVPIMFGLISISDIFVPIFFGDGYEKVKIILPVLSLLVVIIGLSNVNGIQYFVPIGKENILTLTVCVGAVVNLILNLFLIPRFYSIGACIATVVAELCVTLTGFIYIYKTKQFSVKEIFSSSIKYFISGIIMFLVIMAVKIFVGQNFFDLLLLIILGIIIYSSSLLLLKDKFFTNLFNQAIDIIRKVLKKKIIVGGNK